MHPADAEAVPHARRRDVRGTLAGDGGWALVEVVWSALVLTIVVVAVLSGMDTAAISSGLSRARSTGATLAEQDQERLRSMRAVDLSNYTERRTVNLGGGPYAVYREPPYFLEPVATAWRIVRQNEQVPAR